MKVTRGALLNVVLAAATVAVFGVALYRPYWIHYKSVWMTSGVIAAFLFALEVRDSYLDWKERHVVQTGAYAHEMGDPARVEIPQHHESEVPVYRRGYESEQQDEA